MLIKRVHYIVRSSAFYSQNPYCATKCNVSLHSNTTQLSIEHFHAKHYTNEYNVFLLSVLCIVSLEIVCVLFSRNLSSKLRQRGATVDTQFRDS